MWFNILKVQESISDIGLDFESPDEKLQPKDNSCNNQLKAYADKLSTMTNLLEERWKAGWPKHSQYFNENSSPSSFQPQSGYNTFGLNQISFRIDEREDENVLWEEIWYIYEPVPEEVACKAIELIESTSPANETWHDPKPVEMLIEGINWKIKRHVNWNYQDNRNTIEIYTDESGTLDSIYSPNRIVIIGWRNGEDTSLIENDVGGFIETHGPEDEGNNVYYISGYYQGRNAGMSWHK